jgi:hypothetical protein
MTDPGPLTQGASCARCDAGLQGGAIAQTVTDDSGHFSLTNVPATANVPIVIQIGKWRRILNIPNIAACQDLPVVVADTTLPKSMTDMTPNTVSVDMPHIAISTGSYDALECLPRKLGISDTEISTVGQPGHIHLFADPTAKSSTSNGQGANKFKAGFAGGSGNFADSQNLWNPSPPTYTGGFDVMKNYDIVMLSCEGGQYDVSKPQVAINAMKQYADYGGRVFASHWHNVWIEGSANVKPAVWAESSPGAMDGIATWNATDTDFNDPPDMSDPGDLIDEVHNPKGMSFATWMVNVTGLARDVITISEGRTTAASVDNNKAERWVYHPVGTNPTVEYPQNFQFTTPNEMPSDQRCGKVVFSDMHVSSGSQSRPGTAYPIDCSTAAMTPQEKALAFMFFDIASCVGSIF